MDLCSNIKEIKSIIELHKIIQFFKRKKKKQILTKKNLKLTKTFKMGLIYSQNIENKSFSKTQGQKKRLAIINYNKINNKIRIKMF